MRLRDFSSAATLLSRVAMHPEFSPPSRRRRGPFLRPKRCRHDQRGSVRISEFLFEMFPVGFHRFGAEPQAPGDFPGPMPQAQKPKHLEFAVRHTIQRGSRLGGVGEEMVDQVRFNRTTDVNLTAQNGTNCLHDPFSVLAFHEVTPRSRAQRPVRVDFLLASGKNEGSNHGLSLGPFPHEFEGFAIREIEVEHHQIRAGGDRGVSGGGQRVRFSAAGEIGYACQPVNDPRANYRDGSTTRMRLLFIPEPVKHLPLPAGRPTTLPQEVHLYAGFFYRSSPSTTRGNPPAAILVMVSRAHEEPRFPHRFKPTGDWRDPLSPGMLSPICGRFESMGTHAHAKLPGPVMADPSRLDLWHTSCRPGSGG